MKTLLKGMLLAAGLALGANTVLAAEGDWIETHLKGKIGRNTPMETDRLDAERASQASRIEPSGPQPFWLEQQAQRKQGRYSRMEEARILDGRPGEAFREVTAPVPTWIEQHLMRKQGQ